MILEMRKKSGMQSKAFLNKFSHLRGPSMIKYFCIATAYILQKFKVIANWVFKTVFLGVFKHHVIGMRIQQRHAAVTGYPVELVLPDLDALLL